MTYSCINLQLARFLLRAHTRARFIYKKGANQKTVNNHIRLISIYDRLISSQMSVISGLLGLRLTPPAFSRKSSGANPAHGSDGL